jgi:hypothetical protein
MSVPIHQLFAPPDDSKKRSSSAVEPIDNDEQRVVKAARSGPTDDVAALNAAVKRAVRVLKKAIIVNKAPTNEAQWADLILKEVELAYDADDECSEHLNRRQRKYADLIADRLQKADDSEDGLPLEWLNPFRITLPLENASDEYPCVCCSLALDLPDNSTTDWSDSPRLCGRCLISLDAVRLLVRYAAGAHERRCTDAELRAHATVRHIRDKMQIQF